jgi:hypothetical protein
VGVSPPGLGLPETKPARPASSTSRSRPRQHGEVRRCLRRTPPDERLLGDLDTALAEICRLAEDLPHQTDQIRQLFLDGNGDVLRLVLPDDAAAGSAFPALALSKALSDFPEQVETVAGVVEALVEQLHTATSAYREIATTTQVS